MIWHDSNNQCYIAEGVHLDGVYFSYDGYAIVDSTVVFSYKSELYILKFYSTLNYDGNLSFGLFLTLS